MTAGEARRLKDDALRFDLVLPVLRVNIGIFQFDPIEKLLGVSLADVLEPLRIAPIERRPSASGTAVEVHHLALPEGEGLAIPLGQLGELGFANEGGLLALTVPAAWGQRLATRFGGSLVRGLERGRSLDGTADVVTCWLRLRPGMRAALPVGALGELRIETA